MYSGLLECPLTTRVSKTVTKDGPFGGKSGHVNYYDPNPPANNCLKEPCGLPEDKPSTVNRPTTVGAKNMTIDWVNYCEPEPRESILHDRNPTCDLEAYVGGLQVCKHMWSLLDADQVSTAARTRLFSLRCALKPMASWGAGDPVAGPAAPLLPEVPLLLPRGEPARPPANHDRSR